MDRVNIVSFILNNFNLDLIFHFSLFTRQLTTAFDGAIEITKSNQLQLNVQSKLEDKEINVMKDLLILNRQHEIYVRKLLGNLKSIKSKIELHVQSYGEKLLKLHDIVQYRSAVPSVQIFPKFKELTEEWMTLHDLSYVLSQQNQINNYLQHLSELCRQQQFDEIVHKLLGENQVETDHIRLQKRRHLKLDLACSSSVSIVQPPESNSEVKIIFKSIFTVYYESINNFRSNISAFVLTCWQRVEFYYQAFLKWEQFCGIREFTAFSVSKPRNFSFQSLESEFGN
jgi:hypothetical protein